MSTPRFDRRAPHGTIHPPYNGALYEQGGHFFGVDGVYLFSGEGAGQAAPQAPAANSRFGMKQLAPVEPVAAPEAPAAAPAAEEAPVVPQEPAAVPGQPDLVAWAKGDVNYPFYQVSKYVKATYPHIVLTNTKTIVEGLVSAGVVAAADAKRA